MASNWPRLPAFQHQEDAVAAAPATWSVHQIDQLFTKLSIGKRFDQKSCQPAGAVPVIDQSASGTIGFHDEPPGINASDKLPVITFANHTCEMRLMREPFSVIQNVFPMRGTADCDTLFFYYATKGRVHLEEYKGHFPDFRRLWIAVPPEGEQIAIAQVLASLDAKIELNRRMNGTLEAMARALFQSWFVDFDPVRAKQQGRPPAGLDPATADLFVDRLDASPAGPIPLGWRVGTLGEVGKQVRRGVDAKSIGETTPYIGLEHMPRRSVALAEWGAGAGLESNKSAFDKGDILFGKLRPYFHKVGVAPLAGVCSTDIIVLSPTSSDWFGFVLGHVSSVELVNHTDAMSTGTKMPRAKWQDIADFEVTLPPPTVAAAFTAAVQPMIDRIVANVHEGRTLAALRDALLPKLLSGELSVAQAEDAAAAVI